MTSADVLAVLLLSLRSGEEVYKAKHKHIALTSGVITEEYIIKKLAIRAENICLKYGFSI
jgi:hypothetical protein